MHEGAISRKKGLGKTSTTVLKASRQYAGAENYTAMKIMACNKPKWKAANQSKRLKDKKKNFVWRHRLK
jgi:hypothetical protein